MRLGWRRKLIQGYIDCARWSSNCEIDGEDIYFDEIELARGEFFRAGIRLMRWARKWEELLNRAEDLIFCGDARSGRWNSWELLGHDVWLSQVGAGTGAWDRESLEVDGVGDAVTEASKELGQGMCLYVDDDGEGRFFG